jgi:hypothetical protein
MAAVANSNTPQSKPHMTALFMGTRSYCSIDEKTRTPLNDDCSVTVRTWALRGLPSGTIRQAEA